MSKYDALKLENQLCFPLYACSKEVVRQYKPYLDEIELTYTQYIAMMALWEEESLTVKELGKRLFLDSGTLTPLLKKMEKLGLVTRRRDTHDERNVIVTVTEKGFEVREKAVSIPEKLMKCINLSEPEARELYVILRKLLASFGGE